MFRSWILWIKTQENIYFLSIKTLKIKEHSTARISFSLLITRVFLEYFKKVCEKFYGSSC